MTDRVERHLGWFTRPEYPGLGEVPPEAEIVECLKAGVCPLCGRGGYIVPLNHISLKHGIDSKTMRDLAGLKVKDSVCDPTYSALVSERERAAGRGGYKGALGYQQRRTVADARRRASPEWRGHLRRIAPDGAKAIRRERITLQRCMAEDCANFVATHYRRTCSDECVTRMRSARMSEANDRRRAA